MKADEYLDQVRILSVRIDQKKDELMRVHGEAEGIKGMRYDLDKVQTSPSDHMPDMIIRCIELEKEIQRDIIRNQEFRHKIINQIQNLPDVRHVQVLYSKYVELKDNSEIASDLHYAEDYVRKLCGRALSEFDRRYRKTYKRVVGFSRESSDRGGRDTKKISTN